MNILIILFITVCAATTGGVDYPDYPEGYYPFQEAPRRNPPKVRKPPYLQSDVVCPGILETEEEAEESLNNLCGDLNDGTLPRNPLGQQVKGHSYPFEIIKEKTLDFFSNTLPVLKEDQTLPKVAKFKSPIVPLKDRVRLVRRPVRSVDNHAEVEEEEKEQKLQTTEEVVAEGRSLGALGRGARSFCDKNWGLLCLLYNTMSGNAPGGNNAIATNRNDVTVDDVLNSLDQDGLTPLTPCPSAVEYVTPVFARNYQGVWRYVVQIPYEGYFTQTVEVTQCLGKKCHYLVGSCLASPRWVSLLVAEIYYPDAHFPTTPRRPNFSRAAVNTKSRPNSRTKRQFGKRQLHNPGHRNQLRGQTPALRGQAPALQGQTPALHGQAQLLGGSSQTPSKEDSSSGSTDPHYCDGRDSIGCFQVRLYYDWFLIPGSCKCWKQDYFSQLAYK